MTAIPMYETASKEPLDVIRQNECEGDANLATIRFQALWNEIERLRNLGNQLDYSRERTLQARVWELESDAEQLRLMLAAITDPTIVDIEELQNMAREALGWPAVKR